MALFKSPNRPHTNFGYDVNYTVTRDGQRFLISTLSEDSDPLPTRIVLNWPAALGRH